MDKIKRLSEIEEVLHGLGLGKNDVKVYLALLRQGKSSVVDIARTSGVHRVNVYDALRALEKSGLCANVAIAGKSFFSAANPEHLNLLLKEREEQLRTIIPLLTAPFEKTENKSQNFEGFDGIKRILEDMLMVGQHIYAFGIPRTMPEIFGGYLATFHRRRIDKHISIDHIYNENARERIAYLNKIKYSKAKYLPPEYSVPATTIIYGDKVAFWIWSETPFSVLIESKAMADAYRKYFHLLWTIAKGEA